MTGLARQKRGHAPQTPVRAALREDSQLRPSIKDGLGAVLNAHRSYFEEAVRSSFADSLDIDEALKVGREQENRWDYLLGHLPSKQVVGVELHSAKNSEITTVINKRGAARRQLHEHLREGVFVAKWLWVASGQVQFAPMEKATFQLAENGIKFVGRKITHKHLR